MPGSIETDPRVRADLVVRLENWYGNREKNIRAQLADWEKDKVFVALALTEYQLDMELCVCPRFEPSARTRMRLRWEGHRLLPDARAKVEALRQAAELALAAMSGEAQD